MNAVWVVQWSREDFNDSVVFSTEAKARAYVEKELKCCIDPCQIGKQTWAFQYLPYSGETESGQISYFRCVIDEEEV